MTFDTLTYARRLKEAGVPEKQAEAMADATRELVMLDVASKTDIAAVRPDLKADIAAVRSDLSALEQRLKADMLALEQRLTLRMGLMLGAGLSLAVALIGLLVRLH